MHNKKCYFNTPGWVVLWLWWWWASRHPGLTTAQLSCGSWPGLKWPAGLLALEADCSCCCSLLLPHLACCQPGLNPTHPRTHSSPPPATTPPTRTTHRPSAAEPTRRAGEARPRRPHHPPAVRR